MLVSDRFHPRPLVTKSIIDERKNNRRTEANNFCASVKRKEAPGRSQNVTYYVYVFMRLAVWLCL